MAPSDPDELQKRLADLYEVGALIAEQTRRNPKPPSNRKHALSQNPGWLRSQEKARTRLKGGDAIKMGAKSGWRKRAAEQEALQEVRRLLNLRPDESEKRARALQRFMSDF